MWNLSSRIHKLNHFPDDGVNCYVKRDDELGCGISGSKLRKYTSLIPFFLEKEMGHLIIIAGPQSNNLLAALQIARELKLKVTAFLIRPRSIEIKGNFKLSLLFLNEEEIIWVARDQWDTVDTLAKNYLDTLEGAGFILNEGASVSEALSGAMSLADDIVSNEEKSGFLFQHIFVDAGTGFSAAGLIKGLAQRNHQSCIHVLLLADEEHTFKYKLEQWIGMQASNYQCFRPATAKSFGSVNQHIKSEIRRMAREEGILADPVYAAKLFHESRKFIVTEQLKGNVLIIHSGGTLTMAGFEL